MHQTTPDPTSRKRGRPRDAAKLSRVLRELSLDPSHYLEWGPPPYNVADLARRLEMDASNLSAYLAALARDGLVVREQRAVECWNAIARGHLARRVVCYWNAATMEQDKAQAHAWRAGADERAAVAFERLFKPHTPPGTENSASGCIDVLARVVPDVGAIG